ncbi:hypothetical protein SAMN05216386_2966 [Nitrosospira briensis]|uniref:Plasmid segregation centromere-binding protein ParG n=1 Tax=Nitrosospira briensis TaxID=35799 RepID=A0A1I5FCW3_9PROT|nr:hypothetical protein [Nitrosospira briensis]SFO21577.1 hypothetical protein SAMN05216386_2966 [Nitrosospira briensis]
MAKAVILTPDALAAPQITPKAATPARSPVPLSTSVQKAEQIPLQVRIPRHAARAIKIAAAERDQTISDFMLACFHAYMKDDKHA